MIIHEVQPSGATHLNWSKNPSFQTFFFLFYIFWLCDSHPAIIRIIPNSSANTVKHDVLLESSCIGESCLVLRPLYIPLPFIRQPSGHRTGHKGIWLDGVKRMGEDRVSVFGERSGVTALWQHMSRPGSHTLHLLNERVCSLLSAICPHLHIRQRAKWPNARFDAKQTQWFAGLIPPSDPASAFVSRLQLFKKKKEKKRTGGFTFYIHDWSIQTGITLKVFQPNCISNLFHEKNTSCVIFLFWQCFTNNH